ncbi:hypothetical protein DES39_0548 [Orbus hercynius]|uniref:Uncharacterized protein n=1 Tax=Orbus hercynius TaxID=593135 RepID=A0A495RKM0_9GAMM|nr:hypothetical protein [Orbus hercynius]RKS87328.1 hypothetical protein DES39_0548 [Orbus hercynius]
MAGGGILEAKLKAYKKQAEQLKGKSLEVGFFEGSTYPDGTKVAEVAYWNEFGVPENNQPPRPFFRQAIAENKNDWVAKVRLLLEQGATIDQVLTILGQDIVVDIKASIAAFQDPPLSEATKAAKRAKKSLHPDKPLLDTEVMYQAVQWVINNEN